jgi:hypothetical protein
VVKITQSVILLPLKKENRKILQRFFLLFSINSVVKNYAKRILCHSILIKVKIINNFPDDIPS